MIRKRIQSFAHAFAGVFVLMKTQANAWIHLLATIVVVSAGIAFEVSRLEWCVLVLSMAMVWVAEAINTAIEFAIDLASPEYHELAKKSKDVAAGAVLLAAFASVAVGALIFGPHLVALMGLK